MCSSPGDSAPRQVEIKLDTRGTDSECFLFLVVRSSAMVVELCSPPIYAKLVIQRRLRYFANDFDKEFLMDR